MFRYVLMCLLVCTGAAGLAAPNANLIEGPVKVIDGDTLDVGTQRVRIFGIDAVEVDQSCRHPVHGEWACGQEVKRRLQSLLDGKTASCTRSTTDRYGRAVAVCHIADTDLGAALVEAGWAFAYKRYSNAYVAHERRALRAGRGLWTSVVVRPEMHRDAGKVKTAQTAPNGCDIKGNISADGKRIYHLPGQSFYRSTRISEAKGERWFCTEAAARMAGWRRARR